MRGFKRSGALARLLMVVLLLATAVTLAPAPAAANDDRPTLIEDYREPLYTNCEYKVIARDYPNNRGVHPAVGKIKATTNGSTCFMRLRTWSECYPGSYLASAWTGWYSDVKGGGAIWFAGPMPFYGCDIIGVEATTLSDSWSLPPEFTQEKWIYCGWNIGVNGQGDCRVQ